MKVAKLFKPYDFNFYGEPWGASVGLTRKGTLVYFRPASTVNRLATGETIIEVYTRLGFVAFGQKNLRTGREKIKYYEVLDSGKPIEVSSFYITQEILGMRRHASLESILDGFSDRRLVVELEKRGFRITALNRHQPKIFTIEDE